jgi:hypothetical protein
MDQCNDLGSRILPGVDLALWLRLVLLVLFTAAAIVVGVVAR